MRIIAGKAKGRQLSAPPGMETRPTSDKAREAIFGSIQFEITGARVLDLFAGSGAMGIEALSRGADEAVFVDALRNAINAVRTNLSSTGLKGTVLNEDFRSALARLSGKFDFIFIDPPYASGFYEEAVNTIIENSLLDAEGKIIIEHDGRLEGITFEGLKVLKDKRYGKAHVMICALEE